ncbi:MAG: 3-hydroxyacyl-CoA dehydrogenase [Deltaproteobacteria bacterium]|nr:MAG: 3-hydroxyacyl-CoA dehydrogenase [Deltaproteobacteria bacterium]
MDIKGRGFIVTGGSSGLGAATVRMLAEEGGKVLIADVNPPREELKELLEGGSVIFQETDVSSEESAGAAVKKAEEAFGSIYGLVNAAGIAVAEKVLGKEGPHRFESFVRCIQVNLVGSFNMIRLVAASMAKNEPFESDERGVIVNTASVAAFEGQIGQAAYSASKGGVVGMTLPIARELAAHGIRVVTIAPGIFDTPMLAGLGEKVRNALAAAVPFPKRLGRPEEYAFLVKHIIENQMLNGEVIRLDGAIRLTPR